MKKMEKSATFPALIEEDRTTSGTRAMNDEPIRRLLQSLRQWGEQSDSALLSDGELLERFRTWRDQAAFELLLWRHGPMVLGVCRRLLSGGQDAEDAFQAVW